ncbi:hypothetical protein GQX73_g5958 [Xylaria multiplex]|uniref:Uncharacterized protein n=1 Tax=Xylaria multiplex TaxID=323545 RepID=A0A7C8MSI1_9PEZI|nr:hypothetical protein GQX73_g5958 [Xylaria multiplex]
MASLNIEDSDIPSQAGKVSIVTGGSSGIGLATTRLLAAKGATVHVLDVHPPPPDAAALPNVHYRACDVAQWDELRAAFDAIGHIDHVFPNAGVVEVNEDHFSDARDAADGRLLEPSYGVLDVNLRAVLNTVKLAWSRMRRQEKGRPYAVVLTISIYAYTPGHNHAVYSGAKMALLGLLRTLRSVMILDGITLNGVAPGSTITGMVSAQQIEAFESVNVAVSAPASVARALVYSAVATQERGVELYGKDKPANLWTPGRWNGRVILVLGETYVELEEPYADLLPYWFGRENAAMSVRQQALGDLRPEQ